MSPFESFLTASPVSVPVCFWASVCRPEHGLQSRLAPSACADYSRGSPLFAAQPLHWRSTTNRLLANLGQCRKRTCACCFQIHHQLEYESCRPRRFDKRGRFGLVTIYCHSLLKHAHMTFEQRFVFAQRFLHQLNVLNS